jgi:hypothetical protein
MPRERFTNGTSLHVTLDKSAREDCMRLVTRSPEVVPIVDPNRTGGSGGAARSISATCYHIWDHSGEQISEGEADGRKRYIGPRIGGLPVSYD